MPRTLSPRKSLRPEPAPNRKRWTRQECEFLVRSELLTGRYELIDGEIISKRGQNPPHFLTVMLITSWLMRLFGEYHVQCQGPIDLALPDSAIHEPEPDVAVIVQEITHFADHYAVPKDLLLVVEVSDTTLRFDLRTKAALYARAGIAEYWVADIIGRRLVTHRLPTPNGYRKIVEYAEDETLSPLSRPDATVRVGDLLPPV